MDADNFATRFLCNDAAFFTGKPLFSASILGFEGQLSIFDGTKGPCYRCIFPEPPPSGTVPSCAEAGVFGVLPGIFGTLQGAEIIKWILKTGQSLAGYFLTGDILTMDFQKFEIQKNPDCPLCGRNPKIKEIKEEHFICSSNESIRELTSQELKDWFSNKNFQLVDVRESFELEFCKLNYTHHIPLSEIESRSKELSQETPIVIYCKAGGRSLKAAQILKAKGFNVFNLKGGILDWIKNIDSTLSSY